MGMAQCSISTKSGRSRECSTMTRRSRHTTLTTALTLACIAFLGLTIHPTTAFKASDFKTCSTSSFCERHRSVEANDPNRAHSVDGVFQLDASGSSASATVVRTHNPHNDRPLTLTITPYGEEGVVRVKFDDPSYPRYEIGDVLVDGFDKTKNKIESMKHDARSGTTAFTLSTPSSTQNQPVTVQVTHAPLRIALSIGSTETVVFNYNGKFDFERYQANGPKKSDDDDDGKTASWSETFNGHVDTRPNGPMAVTLDISFPGDQVDVYGIPERATSLSLRDTKKSDESEKSEKDSQESPYSEPYRLYNLDVFEYEHDSPFGLYGSIPVMHARQVRTEKGSAFSAGKQSVSYSGIYVHNPTETFVEVARDASRLNTLWMLESGAADFFLLPGPTPASAQRQYAQITGTTAMPPSFSLGYHQCRWNYRDEQDVADVDAGFDSRDIPYDVLWLDIEHTDGKRYMTWDKSHFPTPDRMINDLASRGRKMVTIVDPHVKKDANYDTFTEAEKKRLYVRQPDGGDFDGWCWPGSSTYLDVVSEKVRNWWAGKFSLQNYKGSTTDLHVWNDMNEPSVFNGPEITMRKDLKHSEGTVEHREVHNAFGMFYHMATAEGLKIRTDPNERPLVLSRAFFAGTQRVGPVWTGDNAADWDHLKKSIPMTLTLGVSGLTWSGADVGGFFGDPSPELMTRWYQLGIFYPFFRGHAHLNTKRREPWMFGDPYTGCIKSAIRRRYALMPYLYTLFEAAHREGTPVLRPLWFEFPDDDSVAKIDTMAMVGPALLLAPVLDSGVEEIKIYLPKGAWYDYETSEKHVGPVTVTKSVTIEYIPLFIRGGYIVPRKDRARRSVAAQAGDPLTLLVAPDENGQAVGEIYVDDGKGYAYSVSEKYVRRGLVWSSDTMTCLSPSSTTAKASGVESGSVFAGRGTLKGGKGGDFADADIIVERVSILGTSVTNSPYKKGLVKKSGISEPTEVAIVAASSSETPNAPRNVIAARKPEVKLAEEWTIEFAKK